MQTTVNLPRAFSVRDENEFYPIQHLMVRMNPALRVARVATGVHVNGGSTVLWGLVYLNDDSLSEKTVKKSLKDAGLDFQHNVLIQITQLVNGSASS